MRLNRAVHRPATVTHEGHPAQHLTPRLELRRSVLASMLFEETYYEEGSAHALRVARLVQMVPAEEVAALAIEAREAMHLRHIPLFLVRELARTKWNGRLVADTLARVIQRPDELTEYLAIYWQGGTSKGKRPFPLSKGSQKGLARAFAKFNEYALAKYDQDKGVKLRDVLRLAHPRPSDASQAGLWKRVVKRTLETPDTWEVALSGGADKRQAFERLLKEDKLGGLAFLRNLRNMKQAGVDERLVKARFGGSFERVLPFRFIAAARAVPGWEAMIEPAMLDAMLGTQGSMRGKTALIVDTSPSMHDELSEKSDMTRLDAACALATLLRELCEDVRIWAFNNRAHEIPARRGFALADVLRQTVGNYSKGGLAVREANKWGYGRIIVLTDGQWHSSEVGASSWDTVKPTEVETPLTSLAYMVNMATYHTGVGYGKWVNVDGWSERIIDFIQSYETDQPIMAGSVR
jgi:60 kDa SS-A/Ro ribonucleoprotein